MTEHRVLLGTENRSFHRSRRVFMESLQLALLIFATGTQFNLPYINNSTIPSSKELIIRQSR